VGQMVHPYLNRRAGREPVVPLHPSLEPVLARTLGVPLFQEQLLRMAMVAAGFTGGQAEELRRAMGFKRSEARMKQIEVQLREGMVARGIVGETAERIIQSITSFALYGFPESHAASFALLVYASAYLKAHYPAAFYTALLNNQPMGFYHPATLVKDAQRHGVRFAPIDVLASGWECCVEADGRVRLGLMYVNGLREEIGRRIAAGGDVQPGAGRKTSGPDAGVGGGKDAHRIGTSERWYVGQGPEVAGAGRCPKCGCDDQSMLEDTPGQGSFCNVCAHEWGGERAVAPAAGRLPDTEAEPRFASIEDLIARTGIRRDELATLAEIGALNAFGEDRRSALWQIERAVRPSGELFTGQEDRVRPAGDGTGEPARSPLRPMTAPERLMADYAGTSLTIGPHPMALRRAELALGGVLRARDLPHAPHGRRVRVAGAVITRQRPGTAKGFVFLTLEDETGIANIIVRPDLFGEQRGTIVGEPYLIVEGTLQIQEGVTSVRAERVLPLVGRG
ncbi:MAG TPA: OB-fold nucleic acid binding domain-containing protein, partial [Vicinamibacterales bacterium]|nr:OB-fold nucleic acid binding domain-containing protein [Vicinamibacterales bacterium]